MGSGMLLDALATLALLSNQKRVFKVLRLIMSSGSRAHQVPY